jgi:DNA-binding transcriptional regulator YiaG
MGSTRKCKAKSFPTGRGLIAGLREALRAVQSGDYSNLIVRELEIADPREYGPADIKALRAKLGVTQGIFARLVGVSADLVAHWEHGIRTPAPLARRLLDKINENPAIYLSSVVKRRQVTSAAGSRRKAG